MQEHLGLRWLGQACRHRGDARGSGQLLLACFDQALQGDLLLEGQDQRDRALLRFVDVAGLEGRAQLGDAWVLPGALEGVELLHHAAAALLLVVAGGARPHPGEVEQGTVLPQPIEHLLMQPTLALLPQRLDRRLATDGVGQLHDPVLGLQHTVAAQQCGDLLDLGTEADGVESAQLAVDALLALVLERVGTRALQERRQPQQDRSLGRRPRHGGAQSFLEALLLGLLTRFERFRAGAELDANEVAVRLGLAARHQAAEARGTDSLRRRAQCQHVLEAVSAERFEALHHRRCCRLDLRRDGRVVRPAGGAVVIGDVEDGAADRALALRELLQILGLLLAGGLGRRGPSAASGGGWARRSGDGSLAGGEGRLLLRWGGCCPSASCAAMRSHRCGQQQRIGVLGV